MPTVLLFQKLDFPFSERNPRISAPSNPRPSAERENLSQMNAEEGAIYREKSVQICVFKPVQIYGQK